MHFAAGGPQLTYQLLKQPHLQESINSSKDNEHKPVPGALTLLLLENDKTLLAPA
jgi:hypothetical protein